MKITDVELTFLDVPFTAHTNQHMQYWLPNWRIVQLCKITLSNGVVGWGETIPNYTWAKVPENIEKQIVGKEAADLLWQDHLGAGVQEFCHHLNGKRREPGIRQQPAREGPSSHPWCRWATSPRWQ